jgi:shikimate kinase
MNSKKNLVFLGMMGSGKSSIGSLISKKLDLKFIDIDNIIEDVMGMSISNIFKEKGEGYFRNLEEKITLKNLKTPDSVISLGGGGFINEKIREEILTKHFSFWLNWDDSVLLKRIKGSKKRPLVHKSTDQEIKKLIKKRSKIYLKAEFKINCNKLTKAEIIKEIIKIYESNQTSG